MRARVAAQLFYKDSSCIKAKSPLISFLHTRDWAWSRNWTTGGIEKLYSLLRGIGTQLCCFLWFCTPPRGYTRWGEISIIVFTFVWWNKGWTVCKDRLYQSVGLHFLIADKQVISLLREDNARVVMIDRFASCHSKLVEKLHRKIVYHRQGLSSFDQAATFCRLHTGNWVVDKLQVRLFSFLNSFKFVKQWRLYCVCVCMYEAQLKTFSPACGNTKWNDEF